MEHPLRTVGVLIQLYNYLDVPEIFVWSPLLHLVHGMRQAIPLNSEHRLTEMWIWWAWCFHPLALDTFQGVQLYWQGYSYQQCFCAVIRSVTAAPQNPRLMERARRGAKTISQINKYYGVFCGSLVYDHMGEGAQEQRFFLLGWRSTLSALDVMAMKSYSGTAHLMHKILFTI